jgi:hypothetical protein
MAIPNRELVTGDELNAILTREIREIEDLHDAKLTYQYLLREHDETGCNWSGAVLNPGPIRARRAERGLNRRTAGTKDRSRPQPDIRPSRKLAFPTSST